MINQLEINDEFKEAFDLINNTTNCVFVTGNAGRGKSTLLNILGLLDKPSEGFYKLAGIAVSHYSNNELAALINYYWVLFSNNLISYLSLPY
jgi:ABC-type lipoprotein export system ATPase subunit